MSRESLDRDPDLQKGAETARQCFEGFPAKAKAYRQELKAWEDKYFCPAEPPVDSETIAAYAGPAIPTDEWRTVSLPGKLSAQGLPDASIIWLRKKVTLLD